MDWPIDDRDRLFELYGKHIDRLLSDVAKANRRLGSPNPEKTRLRRLSRAEFEAMLCRPADDVDLTRQWLRRIIRGHEREFPRLMTMLEHPDRRASKTAS
jgi:hypothetical protein